MPSDQCVLDDVGFSLAARQRTVVGFRLIPAAGFLVLAFCRRISASRSRAARRLLLAVNEMAEIEAKSISDPRAAKSWDMEGS
jgi:hypothetical protein